MAKARLLSRQHGPGAPALTARQRWARAAQTCCFHTARSEGSDKPVCIRPEDTKDSLEGWDWTFHVRWIPAGREIREWLGSKHSG